MRMFMNIKTKHALQMIGDGQGSSIVTDDGVGSDNYMFYLCKAGTFQEQ